MWPFKKKYPEIPAAGVPESWSVFRGQSEGKPLFARANLALKAFIGHPRYAHQVEILIQFRSPDDNGFPQSEESAQLMDLEDKLVPAMENDNEGILAAVITTNGFRRFIFYTSQPENIQPKLKSLQLQFAGHTIQGTVTEDRNWSAFQVFV
jgi:hypothetical protein